MDKCKWYEKILNEANVRVHGDYRDNYSPGWKFNHWELKGVPVRLEVGPKDLDKQACVAVRRDTGVKLVLDDANAVREIKKLFVDIHNSLYAKAVKDLKASTSVVDTWPEFMESLNANKIMVSPFCGHRQCEDRIKTDSAQCAIVEEGAPAMGAKSLCIPFDQPRPIKDQKCVHPECNQRAQFYTVFGRSY
jgi:bifunctional glutamyl/prolyl-tRNA synthetase